MSGIFTKYVKRANPYRPGSTYYDLFEYWKQKQILTKSEMVRYVVEREGKTVKQAIYDVTVILSPRNRSDRGDCRGNVAAHGHLYFAERLPRKVEYGLKEEQRFRLRWRHHVLEPRVRITNKISNKQEKLDEVFYKHNVTTDKGISNER